MNSTERKQRARQLAHLIEILDLDEGLKRCLEVRALEAESAEIWANIKGLDNMRQQFLTLVNTVANMGPLEYKLVRDGPTAGRPGDSATSNDATGDG